jgi:protein AaeX
MIGEFKFLGMYFPWMLLTSLLALLATRSLSILLARKGFYRHIWHPPLFDVAVFFIVLGLFFTIFSVFRF